MIDFLTECNGHHRNSSDGECLDCDLSFEQQRMEAAIVPDKGDLITYRSWNDDAAADEFVEARVNTVTRERSPTNSFDVVTRIWISPRTSILSNFCISPLRVVRIIEKGNTLQ